jgi:CheY-like chemotaxis protein/two-component sensor histidine kinase
MTLLTMGENDPHRKNVEHILEAARRATSLTQDILLFSRKKFSEKRHIDLNEIVKSVDKFLRRVISEDIDCVFKLYNGTIPIFADMHQVEQVLMNLATNARDALPNGGRLSISTEQIQLDELFIKEHGLGRSSMYAELTVEDDGFGMSEETRLRIFDPFFTTKEVGKGTGLGMAVVYGIIKQHEGHITVNSEPGVGTTFRIYLPLCEIPAEEIVEEPLHNKPVSGTETILIAEDDEKIRNMTSLLLNKFGYEVIVAVDGEDAVRKYRENRGRVQLLLFDVIMPRKSGKEAYDEIRAIEPDIKVIFASGYAPEAVHQKALVSDNVKLISKPYPAANLLTMVRSVLDKEHH